MWNHNTSCSRSPLFIWTRSLDDWEEDKKIFTKAHNPNRKPFHLPCLSFEALDINPMAFMQDPVHPHLLHHHLHSSHSLFFLSPRAVLYAHRHLELRPWIDQAKHILCVGASTKIQAEKTFQREALAPEINSSTAEKAWAYFQRALPDLDRHKIYALSAQETHFHHPKLTKIPLYKTIAQVNLHSSQAQALKEELKNQGTPETPHHIYFASPSAVRGFMDWISKMRLKKSGPLPIQAHAIGETTYKCLQDFSEYRDSFENLTQAPETSLLSLWESGS